MKPCAGCVAPKIDGLGRAERASSLSCSSTLRRVSRSSLSEREGGRVMAGLLLGRCVGELKGDDGLECEREARRLFVGGYDGLAEMMGDGAWICMDMGSGGGARAGTKACLMRKLEGGRRDGVTLCKGEVDVSKEDCGEAD